MRHKTERGGDSGKRASAQRGHDEGNPLFFSCAWWRFWNAWQNPDPKPA